MDIQHLTDVTGEPTSFEDAYRRLRSIRESKAFNLQDREFQEGVRRLIELYERVLAAEARLDEQRAA